MIRENLKPIVFTVALGAVISALGYVWTLVIENRKASVQQQEQIETNTSWIEANKGRIQNERDERRYREIVQQLQSIRDAIDMP